MWVVGYDVEDVENALISHGNIIRSIKGMVCIFGEIGAEKDLFISCMAHYFFSHYPNLVDDLGASIQGVHERNYTSMFFTN